MSHFALSHACLPQVRGKKFLQGQGKVRKFHFNKVRENLSLWKKSGKSKILRVHIYYLPSRFVVFWHLKFFGTFYGHEACCIHEIEQWTDVGFSLPSFLHIMLGNYCSRTLHDWVAEIINKWVETVAVREGWRPLSGQIWEIVNSFNQGNYIFVRVK